MAITGAHTLLHTPEADALRAVLGWKHVEDHPGWPIFELPPAELGVHPSDGAMLPGGGEVLLYEPPHVSPLEAFGAE